MICLSTGSELAVQILEQDELFDSILGVGRVHISPDIDPLAEQLFGSALVIVQHAGTEGHILLHADVEVIEVDDLQLLARNRNVFPGRFYVLFRGNILRRCLCWLTIASRSVVRVRLLRRVRLVSDETLLAAVRERNNANQRDGQ